MLLRSRCILRHCLEGDTHTHIYIHTYTHTGWFLCIQHNEKRHLSYSSHSSLLFHLSLSLSLSLGEPLRPRTRNNKKEQRKAAETAIINPFEKFAIVAKLVTGNSFVVMKEFRGICGVGKVTEETLFLLPSLYLSLSREERIWLFTYNYSQYRG